MECIGFARQCSRSGTYFDVALLRAAICVSAFRGGDQEIKWVRRRTFTRTTFEYVARRSALHQAAMLGLKILDVREGDPVRLDPFRLAALKAQLQQRVEG